MVNIMAGVRVREREDAFVYYSLMEYVNGRMRLFTVVLRGRQTHQHMSLEFKIPFLKLFSHI
jgi:hypothetical protein